MKNMWQSLIRVVAVAIGVGLAAPDDAGAQISVEARVGSGIPLGELAEDPGLNQTAGFAFALDGMYTFNTNLSAYAGFSRQSFHCDGCPVDVNTTGFQGGVKYVFPSQGPASIWVRGGPLLHRASVDGDDNDWGVGIDAGTGVDWLVRSDLALVPALRVDSYNSGPVSLTYVTVDLGLHLHFGEF